MKKILRLVTTSVLTLTLVACGEASSSVSSSVSTSTPVSSSSVSSSSVATSTFAAVSTITLSAASDVLTQTLGAQKVVLVTAGLNANTNPNIAIEWYVNGTKSNQTGRIFEFTPIATGAFVIQARVGATISNNITVNVGQPALAITGDVKVLAADKIEVTAPGGATVTVAGNTVKPSSFYDLTKGIYVIELGTALAQGDTAVVTLAREGSQSVSKSFTWDTRKLEVGKVILDADKDGVIEDGETAVAAVSGVYEITRPHMIASGANGAENTTVNNYIVAFKSENQVGSALAFKLEQVSVPAGATPISTTQGLRSVTAGNQDNVGQILFNVSKNTIPGSYVFRYTLGQLVREVTILVKDTAPTLTFDKYSIGGKNFDLQVVQTGHDAGTRGVTANAAGEFEITKPFISNASNYIDFSFKFDTANNPIPTTLFDQTDVQPNQIRVTLVGPGNVSFMQTNNVTQALLKTPEQLRADFDNFTVTQKIDASTPVGNYTFKVEVVQLIGGTQVISSKDVVVKVVAPTADLSSAVVRTDATSPVSAGGFVDNEDGTYTVMKPRIVTGTALDSQVLTASLTLKNFESAVNISAANSDSFTGAVDGFKKQLLPFSLTYTGPGTLSGINFSEKIGIEIGTGTANVGTVGIALDTTTTFDYYSTLATDNDISIANIFTFTVDALTVSGNYVFTVTLGTLTEIITVNVVNPAVSIDFALASGGDFALNATDGKYYATLPFSGGVNAEFTLLVRNLAAGANVPYTLRQVLPSSSDTKTDTIAFTAAAGNDGHAESAALLNLIDGPDGDSILNITAAGTYEYTVTVGGASKVLTLVVLPHPTLTLESAMKGTTALVKMYDGNFVVEEDGTDPTAVTLKVSGKDLPSGTLFAKIVAGATPTASGEANATAGYIELKFVDGIAELAMEIPANAGGTTIAAYDAVIGIYKKGATTFELVGRKTVKIWVSDIQA